MIKEFFLKRGLRNHKLRALKEAEFDLEYIRLFKSEYLNMDDTELRKRMGELSRKESSGTITPEEMSEFAEINQKIKAVNSVKIEYEKTQQLVQDLKDYISIL